MHIQVPDGDVTQLGIIIHPISPVPCLTKFHLKDGLSCTLDVYHVKNFHLVSSLHLQQIKRIGVGLVRRLDRNVGLVCHDSTIVP